MPLISKAPPPRQAIPQAQAMPSDKPNIWAMEKSKRRMQHVIDKHYRHKSYHPYFLVEVVDIRGGSGGGDAMPYAHVTVISTVNRAVKITQTIPAIDLGADETKWPRILDRKAEWCVKQIKQRVGRKAHEKTLDEVAGSGKTLTL